MPSNYARHLVSSPTTVSFDDSVHILYDKNEQVVQKVNQDCRRQPVFEHEVKEKHATEPGIYHADDTLVRMTIPEVSIHADNCSTHSPPEAIHEDWLQIA